jgi:hypothetical protein
MPVGAIREHDRFIFADAARKLNLWILVRLTNRESLRLIGLPDYYPKPIDCKAKTADFNYVARYKIAGLVVDPIEHRMAFAGGKLAKARFAWDDFQQILQNGSSGYSVNRDPNSPHFGCVTLCRLETGGRPKYLHGDYDLYDAIDAKNVRVNIAIVDELLGQRHLRGPEFRRVQDFVNSRIGISMVQHSDWTKYTHHSDEPVDVFGPQGQACTLLNEFAIRSWYQNQFEGRKTLVEKWSPHQHN